MGMGGKIGTKLMKAGETGCVMRVWWGHSLGYGASCSEYGVFGRLRG